MESQNDANPSQPPLAQGIDSQSPSQNQEMDATQYVDANETLQTQDTTANESQFKDALEDLPASSQPSDKDSASAPSEPVQSEEQMDVDAQAQADDMASLLKDIDALTDAVPPAVPPAEDMGGSGEPHATTSIEDAAGAGASAEPMDTSAAEETQGVEPDPVSSATEETAPVTSPEETIAEPTAVEDSTADSSIVEESTPAPAESTAEGESSRGPTPLVDESRGETPVQDEARGETPVQDELPTTDGTTNAQGDSAADSQPNDGGDQDSPSNGGIIGTISDVRSEASGATATAWKQEKLNAADGNAVETDQSATHENSTSTSPTEASNSATQSEVTEISPISIDASVQPKVEKECSIVLGDVKTLAGNIQPEDIQSIKEADKDDRPKSAGTDTKRADGKTGGEKDDKKKEKPKQTCVVCRKVTKCKYNIHLVSNGDVKHLCDDVCFKVFKANPKFIKHGQTTSAEEAKVIQTKLGLDKITCDQCRKKMPLAGSRKINVGSQNKLFCCADCQDRFRKEQCCLQCMKHLRGVTTTLSVVLPGKGTIRLCSQACKLQHDKALSMPVKDDAPLPISSPKTQTIAPKRIAPPTNANTAAPAKTTNEDDDDDDDVEIIATSKLPSYRTHAKPATSSPAGRPLRNQKCAVCHKPATIKHEVSLDGQLHKLCSDSCFSSFRATYKLSLEDCAACGAHMMTVNGQANITLAGDSGKTIAFCSQRCSDGYKAKHGKSLKCTWCPNVKNHFDMVEKKDPNTGKFQRFCSLNCVSLFRVNQQATSNVSIPCDQCGRTAPAQYHLTMSDASVRNFCTYACVMAFQDQFNTQPGGAKAGAGTTTPASGAGRGTKRTRGMASKGSTPSTPGTPNIMPRISDVVSLAPNEVMAATGVSMRGASNKSINIQPQTPTTVSQGTGPVTQQIIVQPPAPKQQRNKALLCKPYVHTKATSCRPHSQAKQTQTDEAEPERKPVFVPVPVPVYVPVPLGMYSYPMPYPVPMPIPIPVPCFIPTTKKNADKILKHIKEIQERTPADPFEAELLMMAEAVAKEGQDSSSSDEEDTAAPAGGGDDEPAGFDDGAAAPGGGGLGEDILQMALRMATDMPESGGGEQLDLENSLHPTPINPDAAPSFAPVSESSLRSPSPTPSPGRGRGRGGKRRGGSTGRGRAKRTKREPSPPVSPEPGLRHPPAPPTPAPDANYVLKYTYGVNAYKHWVLQKNAGLERPGAGRRSSRGAPKLFKPDLMACTVDELNIALTLFVKEVRKPNGEMYAPDSIFYLCLGIQQYLFENGRIDNIFTDFYFEQFTDKLNEVLDGYEVRLNAHGLIVCRIEEEHLWEAKMLGAHSPHVLLNTLIYFNTKYFMLKTPDEHLKLSFSHIMKHWKKTNLPGGKQPGRAVYLRYYAPSLQQDTSKKGSRGGPHKEDGPMYEQGENLENPLRCPVKLYEFFLSKCPESIKNRNDVFYLVPERSCVPDSPVWYSTSSLGVEAMTKMLNRVRVVKEIQEAHLHHQPQYF